MVVTVVPELHLILPALEFHMPEEGAAVEHLEVPTHPWVLVVLVEVEAQQRVVSAQELLEQQIQVVEVEVEKLVQVAQVAPVS
jgi:hypothetical protein